MNKKVLYIIIAIALFIGIVLFFLNVGDHRNREYSAEKLAEEEILDECTDEYESLQNMETAKVDSEEEKISPNCKMILKKIYTKCGHIDEELVELPKELVNMNKENLEKEYDNWKVEKFSKDEIILSKEYDAECGEHFVLKNNNGKVTVYKVNETGEESLFKSTNISTEYLTQTDLIKIKEGIRVDGIKNLNEKLEDFE